MESDFATKNASLRRVRGFATPNVRGNAGPTGWRQAREAEDVPHGLAGLVPSRWASR